MCECTFDYIEQSTLQKIKCLNQPWLRLVIPISWYPDITVSAQSDCLLLSVSIIVFNASRWCDNFLTTEGFVYLPLLKQSVFVKSRLADNVCHPCVSVNGSGCVRDNTRPPVCVSKVIIDCMPSVSSPLLSVGLVLAIKLLHWRRHKHLATSQNGWQWGDSDLVCMPGAMPPPWPSTRQVGFILLLYSMPCSYTK